MKSLYLAALLAALPVAATAQAVQFNVTCLPEAKQAEVRARAQAITEAAEARRKAAKPVLTAGNAMGLRDEKQAAVAACAQEAKKAGQPTGLACAKEISELREAARLVDDIQNGFLQSNREIDGEERRHLEALRAEYPTCPVNLGPNNAVIRK